MKCAATRTLIVTLGLVSMAAVASAHLVSRADERRDQRQPAGPSGQLRSVWDGVYSDDQASRGESAYLGECARCHGESLLGSEGGPMLVGDSFLEGWGEKTVADLLERIRTTMPADSPGRLSRQQAADIIAFIFRSNQLPVGEKALDTDLAALQMIKIVARRASRDD